MPFEPLLRARACPPWRRRLACAAAFGLSAFSAPARFARPISRSAASRAAARISGFWLRFDLMSSSDAPTTALVAASHCGLLWCCPRGCPCAFSGTAWSTRASAEPLVKHDFTLRLMNLNDFESDRQESRALYSVRRTGDSFTTMVTDGALAEREGRVSRRPAEPQGGAARWRAQKLRVSGGRPSRAKRRRPDAAPPRRPPPPGGRGEGRSPPPPPLRDAGAARGARLLQRDLRGTRTAREVSTPSSHERRQRAAQRGRRADPGAGAVAAAHRRGRCRRRRRGGRHRRELVASTSPCHH